MLPQRVLQATLIAVVVAVIACTAMVLPGWRHRHAGGVTHSHGGPLHTHSHSDESPGTISDSAGPNEGHQHVQDGWHVHVSFFGFECTIWEPGTHEVDAVAVEDVDARDVVRSEHAGSPFAVIATRPTSSGWTSLFFIDPSPVPSRVVLTQPQDADELTLRTDGRYSGPADPPPVPPPRPHFVRRASA